jgi:(5-formylfuran-3-yl)methyl phosphate synthase
MTKMLASVNNLAEAKIVLAEQVDIIDLKDPLSGSLGRLPTAKVAEIVGWVNQRCPISATIGDLPMQPDLIGEAVKQMAETKVDFIKIGIESNKAGINLIRALTALTGNCSLIAVLFADQQPNFGVLDNLKQAGFAGVMLDTFAKSAGSLTDIYATDEIAGFVTQVKSRDMLCGLAGSLALSDIGGLLPMQADYLGFRGALCRGGMRTGELESSAVQCIKQAICLAY